MFQNWVFRKISLRLPCCSILTLLTLLFAGNAKASWEWKKSPSDESWKSFVKLPPSKKAKLWARVHEQGLSFEDMAWEWRLGWVKACSTSEEEWCSSILQHGLFDRALVVRAETAARLGDRFAGTGHKPVLRLLATAYAVKQNSKSSAQASQEPLYVQYRILHAIKQIGGPTGLELGERLARGTQGTAQYWKLLAGNEEVGKRL